VAAAPPVAPATTSWAVVGPPGAVSRLTGHVRSGGRIVADRFVSAPDLVRDERLTLTHTPARKGSCLWASGVRPFTRLRRFAADGHLVWEWHVDRVRQALRLNAPPSGDCLSPDGGRLTIGIYSFDPEDDGAATSLGEGVVAVDRHPDFVAATGRRTHQDYGDERITDLLGWKRGRPATLLFDVVSDAGKTVVHDEAETNGPRTP
jgi:hypothetical protein